MSTYQSVEITLNNRTGTHLYWVDSYFPYSDVSWPGAANVNPMSVKSWTFTRERNGEYAPDGAVALNYGPASNYQQIYLIFSASRSKVPFESYYNTYWVVVGYGYFNNAMDAWNSCTKYQTTSSYAPNCGTGNHTWPGTYSSNKMFRYRAYSTDGPNGTLTVHPS